jgi:subtilisin family serine protease
MKKSISLFVMAVIMAVCGIQSSAQDAGVDYREAFITVGQDFDAAALEQLGVIINSEFDGFITAQIPDGVWSEILAVAGVEHISLAFPVLTCADSARYYSRVDPVHEGVGFDMPYTGNGVIIGVIDCGFDFNHINLCDQEGKTRVKAVYMPLDNSGQPPVIGGHQLPGSCYEDAEQIAQLTSDDPNTTHGTQTAGISAGAYRGNGWHGVAPGADIVACGMPEDDLTDVRVANCIKYINDYARRQGKPCVVNISLGSNVGRHDGSSLLVRACEQVSGPGRVIVVSAGNDGHDNVCFHRSIASPEDTVTSLMAGYGGGVTRMGYLNVWSDENNPIVTQLIVMNTQTDELLYCSEPIDMATCDSAVILSSSSDSELNNYFTGSVAVTPLTDYMGRYNLVYDIRMRSRNKDYTMGFRYNTPNAAELVAWTSQLAYFNSYGYEWAEKGTPAGSINDLATSDSIISVGSYNTKQYIPLRDGSTYFRPSSKPVEISYFSAYGPDENGINRPDVCAPGSVMISSGNRYDVNAPNLQYWQPSAFVNDEEYPYCPDLGTSMSAPVVTGAVALWMEANPNLSAADVRDIIRNTSYRDNNVINGDPTRWGAGKLDVNKGMRYVLHIGNIHGDANGDGEVNIADINAVIDVLLSSHATAEQRQNADINGDGEVNIADINAIIDVILSH